MKTKRIIRKARHTSFRVPGDVDQFILKVSRRTGLAYTRAICDIIRWYAACERNGVRVEEQTVSMPAAKVNP